MKPLRAPMSTKRCIVAMVILGIVLLITGSVGFGTFPLAIKRLVKWNLVLAEGKETFEKWQKTPIPVLFSVYLFNVTNPQQVEKHGAKPDLQEVGPFVFEQLRSKKIRGWDLERKAVTYDDIKTYHFVPSMSEDMEQKVYLLNMPVMGIAQFVGRMSAFVQSILVPTLDNLLETYGEKLFVHRPARELIFEGYKVNILEDLLGFIRPFTKVPTLLPNNTFGFLYGKNNSGDGLFSVYTGEDEISKYTQILSWNNNTDLGWWKDEYCDMLNGTDGAQFPPPITKSDILYVFTAELCRSVFLEFREEVQVKGITAYRFITPERLFASPKDNPDNQCYCTREEYCHLSGILDISSCRKGMPLAVTAPHFYAAHHLVTETVDGMHPVKEEHETYVDIEPTTGVVLRASRKLQMNYMLEKFKGFTPTKNVPDAVFPLLWIKEAAEIDDNIAQLFKSKVKTPITVAKSILTACIILGLLWILMAAFITVYILLKQQKATPKKNIHYTNVPLKPEEEKTQKFKPVNV